MAGASSLEGGLGIELSFDELDLGKGDALSGGQIVIVIGDAEQAVGVLALQILALRVWAAGLITGEDSLTECVHDLTERQLIAIETAVEDAPLSLGVCQVIQQGSLNLGDTIQEFGGFVALAKVKAATLLLKVGAEIGGGGQCIWSKGVLAHGLEGRQLLSFGHGRVGLFICGLANESALDHDTSDIAGHGHQGIG